MIWLDYLTGWADEPGSSGPVDQIRKIEPPQNPQHKYLPQWACNSYAKDDGLFCNNKNDLNDCDNLSVEHEFDTYNISLRLCGN